MSLDQQTEAKTEFGQALKLAMRRGLITKIAMERQLRLRNTLDVQTNKARVKENIEKRAVLRT